MPLTRWQCASTMQRLRLLCCEPFPVVDEIISDLDQLFFSRQHYFQLMACRILIQILTENIHLSPDWPRAVNYANIYMSQRTTSFSIELSGLDYEIRWFSAYANGKLAKKKWKKLFVKKSPLN